MAPLGHLADPAADDGRRGRPREVAALDADFPAAGTHDAAGTVEHGRLARPVRPDQRHPLTFADGQRGPVDRDRLAVADHEVVQLEQRHSVAEPR